MEIKCKSYRGDGDEEDESKRDDYILGLLWAVELSIRLVHNSEDSQKSQPCGMQYRVYSDGGLTN